MNAATEAKFLKILKAIRDEAKKGKPNPDKIYALANNAISEHEQKE